MSALNKAKKEIVRAMREVGIEEAYIYAFEKTGMMLTEMNKDAFSEEDVAEFEYHYNRYLEDNAE